MGWHEGTLQATRPLTKVELEMGRQAVRDQDAAIQAKIKQEDARDDREQREKRVAREAEQRERAEAEVAAMRTAVEQDLRLAGAPSADIGRLADEAVRRFFQARARTAAATPPLEQTVNELRALRRGRSIGAV
ncbi:MAG: hypothetical protein H0V24_04735 [Chloroflexia bacterium]|jgi:hypothetical protein|nr:hypothetical protein [Chloroflexia bacterium]